MKSRKLRQENILIKALMAKMERDDLTLDDLAKRLKISLSYISLIFRGLRPTEGFSMKLYRRIADYLEIPPAQVFLMSGTMMLSDFSAERTFEQKLARARESMLSDPRWIGYLPNDTDWDKLSPDVKMLICLLHEEAGGCKIFASIQSDGGGASL
jgi:transcriptional regulator with XRE-family HTH domain